MTTYSGPEASKVKNMFKEISGGYDKANDFLSLGIHHLWRKKLVTYSGAKKGDSVLDCATGTGDLAIEFKKIVGDARVVGSDFCPEMLDKAPLKAKEKNLDIEFEVADVMNLPYEDGSFEIASISFGIRNVEDPKKALKELSRVVKKGGKVMILEFGQPSLPVFSQVYQAYSKYIIPKLGGFLTKKPEAYSYLEKSSANFPCRKAFCDMVLSTESYEKVEFISLSGGIAYIYKCYV